MTLVGISISLPVGVCDVGVAVGVVGSSDSDVPGLVAAGAGMVLEPKG